MSAFDHRLSKPGSKAGQLQRHVLRLLMEHQADDALPTSNRFLFYELEHLGIAAKSEDDSTRRRRGFPAGEQDVATRASSREA